MPVASKRKVEARKAAPIIAAEPEPQPLEIDLPPAIKVTALVFSYDSAPALRRCLAALEGSNDRASIEILVVDCGSHDESAQLDSEFSNVTMLRLPRYFGRTKALNIGTRTAAGDYLLFMTPEVEVLPTTIPSLVAMLEADPEAAAACPVLLDTRAQTAEQFFRLPTPATGIDLTPVAIDKTAQVFPVEYATFQAFLVRKFFVKGINYLDERYGDSWSDAELCFQIRRASRKTLALPQVTALYTPGSPYAESARTILAADRVHGAAVFFSKHYGFASGLLFRIKSILGALFTFRIPLFAALISGTKIDGSQSGIL
ncbi:MAG TPA: glycosyltransferase [Bryobacteraceae bacterium]|jgi:GT2 family glycosyltransferase|nr:glycosyltransferase [Bryobacteraceae bacterium]